MKLGELLPGRGLIAKLPAAPEAHCGFAAGIPLFLHAVQVGGGRSVMAPEASIRNAEESQASLPE